MSYFSLRGAFDQVLSEWRDRAVRNREVEGWIAATGSSIDCYEFPDGSQIWWEDLVEAGGSRSQGGLRVTKTPSDAAAFFDAVLFRVPRGMAILNRRVDSDGAGTLAIRPTSGADTVTRREDAFRDVVLDDPIGTFQDQTIVTTTTT